MINLIYRDFKFYFYSQKFFNQECYSQKVVQQGTMFQFIYKHLLPEDKLLSLKLYFKYLLQYEDYIETNEQIETNVDLI